MISLRQNEVTLLPFFVRRAAGAAVVSLFLFLVFNLISVSLVTLAPRALLQDILPSTASLIWIILDFVVVVLPLLFHFTYEVFGHLRFKNNFFSYSYGGNARRKVMQSLAILGLGCVIFHLAVVKMVVAGGMTQYQYFGDILISSKTQLGFGFYWFVMIAMTYYLCQCLWCVLVDWGIVTRLKTQRRLSVLVHILFFLVLVYDLFLIAYQVWYL